MATGTVTRPEGFDLMTLRDSSDEDESEPEDEEFLQPTQSRPATASSFAVQSGVPRTASAAAPGAADRRASKVSASASAALGKVSARGSRAGSAAGDPARTKQRSLDRNLEAQRLAAEKYRARYKRGESEAELTNFRAAVAKIRGPEVVEEAWQKDYKQFRALTAQEVNLKDPALVDEAVEVFVFLRPALRRRLEPPAKSTAGEASGPAAGAPSAEELAAEFAAQCSRHELVEREVAAFLQERGEKRGGEGAGKVQAKQRKEEVERLLRKQSEAGQMYRQQFMKARRPPAEELAAFRAALAAAVPGGQGDYAEWRTKTAAFLKLKGPAQVDRGVEVMLCAAVARLSLLPDPKAEPPPLLAALVRAAAAAEKEDAARSGDPAQLGAYLATVEGYRDWRAAVRAEIGEPATGSLDDAWFDAEAMHVVEERLRGAEEREARRRERERAAAQLARAQQDVARRTAAAPGTPYLVEAQAMRYGAPGRRQALSEEQQARVRRAYDAWVPDGPEGAVSAAAAGSAAEVEALERLPEYGAWRERTALAEGLVPAAAALKAPIPPGPFGEALAAEAAAAGPARAASPHASAASEAASASKAAAGAAPAATAGSAGAAEREYYGQLRGACGAVHAAVREYLMGAAVRRAFEAAFPDAKSAGECDRGRLAELVAEMAAATKATEAGVRAYIEVLAAGRAARAARAAAKGQAKASLERMEADIHKRNKYGTGAKVPSKAEKQAQQRVRELFDERYPAVLQLGAIPEEELKAFVKELHLHAGCPERDAKDTLHMLLREREARAEAKEKAKAAAAKVNTFNARLHNDLYKRYGDERALKLLKPKTKAEREQQALIVGEFTRRFGDACHRIEDIQPAKKFETFVAWAASELAKNAALEWRQGAPGVVRVVQAHLAPFQIADRFGARFPAGVLSLDELDAGELGAFVEETVEAYRDFFVTPAFVRQVCEAHELRRRQRDAAAAADAAAAKEAAARGAGFMKGYTVQKHKEVVLNRFALAFPDADDFALAADAPEGAPGEGDPEAEAARGALGQLRGAYAAWKVQMAQEIGLPEPETDAERIHQLVAANLRSLASRRARAAASAPQLHPAQAYMMSQFKAAFPRARVLADVEGSAPFDEFLDWCAGELGLWRGLARAILAMYLDASEARRSEAAAGALGPEQLRDFHRKLDAQARASAAVKEAARQRAQLEGEAAECTFEPNAGDPFDAAAPARRHADGLLAAREARRSAAQYGAEASARARSSSGASPPPLPVVEGPREDALLRAKAYGEAVRRAQREAGAGPALAASSPEPLRASQGSPVLRASQRSPPARASVAGRLAVGPEEERGDSDVERDAGVQYTRPARGGEEGEGEAAWRERQPWLAEADALAPTGYLPLGDEMTAPANGLELEAVYGYRGHDCRQNAVFLGASDEVAFHVAAVAVVMHLGSRRQRFFTGHDDDILCLAAHPRFRAVATGQANAERCVAVWDPADMHELARLACPHPRGVGALAYHPRGALLAGAGLDEQRTLILWHVPSGAALRTLRDPGVGRPWALAFSPFEAGTLAAAGPAGLAFLRLAGPALEARGEEAPEPPEVELLAPGAAPGGDPAPPRGGYTCLAWIAPGVAVAGTADGALCFFRGPELLGRYNAVQRPLFAASAQYGPGGLERLLVGGKDDTLLEFRPALDGAPEAAGVRASQGGGPGGICGTGLRLVRTAALGRLAMGLLDGEGTPLVHLAAPQLCVRAIHARPGALLVGVRNGALFELPDEGPVPCRLLLQARPASPSPALGAAPLRAAQGHAPAFDVPGRPRGHTGEVTCLAVQPSSGQWFATGGEDRSVRVWDASTQLCRQTRKMREAVTALAFAPDGRSLAVGGVDGSVTVAASANVFRDITRQPLKDRRGEVTEVKFSADGGLLAVAGRDAAIDVYEVGSWRRALHLRGHASAVTHLDWSACGRYLRSTCGANALLFWEVAGKMPGEGEEAPVTLGPVPGGPLRDVAWESCTVTAGWGVQGAYERAWHAQDLNAVDRSPCGAVLAVADDFRAVSLLHYPAPLPGMPRKSYRGHAEQVLCARFTGDGRRLLTAGGLDLAVLQWRHVAPDAARARVEEGVDAPDVAEELSASYERPLARERQREATLKAAAALDAPEPAPAAPAPHAPDWLAAAGLGRAALAVAAPAAPPAFGLELEWVHGYRGFDARNNALYLGPLDGSGGEGGAGAGPEVAFCAAAVGVVMSTGSPEADFLDQRQRFYQGHSDDILCLAVHPGGELVATGQIGRSPSVHVWRVPREAGAAPTREAVLDCAGVHSAGVAAVAFSPHAEGALGGLLATAGLEAEHAVAVWDWPAGKLLARVESGPQRVFGLAANPFEARTLCFASFGVAHVTFWRFIGGALQARPGTYARRRGVAPQKGVHALAWVEAGLAVAGTSSGDLHHWRGAACAARTPGAHAGPVFALRAAPGRLLTGGADGMVNVYAADGAGLRPLHRIDLADILDGMKDDAGRPLTCFAGTAPVVRSLDVRPGRLLVGTKASALLELAMGEGGPQAARLLLQGHSNSGQLPGRPADYQGELWGLAVHPAGLTFATAGEDRTVRVWSVADRRQLRVRRVRAPARGLAYSPDGSHLAVAFSDGGFAVLDGAALTDVADRSRDAARDTVERVAALRYSPDGATLAAAAAPGPAAPGRVDLYAVAAPYARVASCGPLEGDATHVDFSADGALLRVNDAAPRLSYWSLRGAPRRLEGDPGPGVQWATHTCPLAPETLGVHGAGSQAGDVSAVAPVLLPGAGGAGPACLSLVAGDVNGFVTLHAWPAASPCAPGRPHAAHSERVTAVAAALGGSRVISAGGADLTVMQWRHPTVEEPDETSTLEGPASAPGGSPGALLLRFVPRRAGRRVLLGDPSRVRLLPEASDAVAGPPRVHPPPPAPGAPATGPWAGPVAFTADSAQKGGPAGVAVGYFGGEGPEPTAVARCSVHLTGFPDESSGLEGCPARALAGSTLDLVVALREAGAPYAPDPPRMRALAAALALPPPPAPDAEPSESGPCLAALAGPAEVLEGGRLRVRVVVAGPEACGGARSAEVRVGALRVAAPLAVHASPDETSELLVPPRARAGRPAAFTALFHARCGGRPVLYDPAEVEVVPGAPSDAVALLVRRDPAGAPVQAPAVSLAPPASAGLTREPLRIAVDTAGVPGERRLTVRSAAMAGAGTAIEARLALTLVDAPDLADPAPTARFTGPPRAPGSSGAKPSPAPSGPATSSPAAAPAPASFAVSSAGAGAKDAYLSSSDDDDEDLLAPRPAPKPAPAPAPAPASAPAIAPAPASAPGPAPAPAGAPRPPAPAPSPAPAATGAPAPSSSGAARAAKEDEDDYGDDDFEADSSPVKKPPPAPAPAAPGPATSVPPAAPPATMPGAGVKPPLTAEAKPTGAPPAQAAPAPDGKPLAPPAATAVPPAKAAAPAVPTPAPAPAGAKPLAEAKAAPEAKPAVEAKTASTEEAKAEAKTAAAPAKPAPAPAADAKPASADAKPPATPEAKPAVPGAKPAAGAEAKPAAVAAPKPAVEASPVAAPAAAPSAKPAEAPAVAKPAATAAAAPAKAPAAAPPPIDDDAF